MGQSLKNIGGLVDKTIKTRFGFRVRTHERPSIQIITLSEAWVIYEQDN